jgi:hypothetical protein
MAATHVLHTQRQRRIADELALCQEHQFGWFCRHRRRHCRRHRRRHRRRHICSLGRPLQEPLQPNDSFAGSTCATLLVRLFLVQFNMNVAAVFVAEE